MVATHIYHINIYIWYDVVASIWEFQRTGDIYRALVSALSGRCVVVGAESGPHEIRV